SLEHTHSQLIALPVVPKRVQEEIDGGQRYFGFRERCVFCDIIQQEKDDGARVVLETDEVQVISPYAPRFPFETWALPKRHISHFENSDAALLQSLAWAVRATIRKIEKTLEHPAYNFVIHTGPVQEGPML